MEPGRTEIFLLAAVQKTGRALLVGRSSSLSIIYKEIRMKPIEITAQWMADGRVIPSDLVIDQARLAVETCGRQWIADDGLHVLVKMSAGQTWELFFDPDAMRWFLVGDWSPASVV